MQVSGSVVCPEGEPTIFVTGCDNSKCYIKGNSFDIFIELDGVSEPAIDISTKAFQMELHLKANESKAGNTSSLNYIKESIKSKKAFNIFDKTYRNLIFNTISNLDDSEVYDVRFAYYKYLSKLPKPHLSEAQSNMKSFQYKPLISIIIPLQNVSEQWLDKCIESVRTQIYENWELIIADDNTSLPYIPSYLEGLLQSDKRIRVFMRAGNGNSVNAKNAALRHAKGEFIAVIDGESVIAQDALYEAVKLLNDKPNADLVYSDEDKIMPDKSRSYPIFKPDWSPELLYAGNYISNFCLLRSELLKGIGGYSSGYGSYSDFEMLLRFTEYTGRIYHIPKMLYSKHITDKSEPKDKDDYDAGVRVLDECLRRRCIPYNRIDYLPDIDMFDVKLQPIAGSTKLTILMYGKGDVTADIPRNAQLISIKEINGASLNKLYSSLSGDYVVFWNRSVAVERFEQVLELAAWASLPGVGAVGPKLYDVNVCYSAGIVLSPESVRTHIGYGEASTGGYCGKYAVTNNVSAVSTKLMVMTRENFEKIAPFDENIDEFISSEVCLMLMTKWLRNVCCSSRLQIHAPVTKEPSPEELKYMQKRWGHNLTDRYYPAVFDSKGTYHIKY
jgi:glycosyltransferase involved in cell wall biosynthesis